MLAGRRVDVVMENRAAAVVSLWGGGWAVGAILVVLVSASRSTWTPSLAFLVALPVGSVLMGVPILFTANEARAAHPRAEAIAWVVAFAAMVSIYAGVVSSEPAAINAVTTADMHKRSPTSPYPPELINFLWCFAGFTVIAGAASGGLEATVCFRPRLLIESALFVLCIAISIAFGLLLFAIGGPIFWGTCDVLPGPPVLHDVGCVAGAAFLCGGATGSGIRYGRRRLAAHRQSSS